MNAILPIPQIDVSVREATLADVPFIDALQKKHSRMVGFMKTKALEGKIAAGEVLVAEDVTGHLPLATGQGVASDRSLTSGKGQGANGPLGYCIGTDRYFKHDDVGIIYQLNVAPGRQRGFVGATLLKAMFDRAAYGCRLFCCWCAQDIEANRFWEAMGFVPLAYRAGSTLRRRSGQGARVHIFWQKRIRSGDTTTPWWFPSRTTGGAMGADRLVLPIPPGTHWSDAKPVILPALSNVEGPGQGDCGLQIADCGLKAERRKRLPGPRSSHPSSNPIGRAGAAGQFEIRNPQLDKPVTRTSGLKFGSTQLTTGDVPKPSVPAEATAAEATAEKKPREKTAKAKNDPRLVAAARELKDRWLERLNGGDGGDDESIRPAAKYDVTRILPMNLPRQTRALMLPAAEAA